MATYTPRNVFSDSQPTNINLNIRTQDNSDSNGRTSTQTDSTKPTLDHSTTPQDHKQNPKSGSAKPPAKSPAKTPKAKKIELDIAARIPGLYRVLDLISEQGSGGLVDKVLIAQDGLKRLINDLHPGAYVALTKVDFKALDALSVRPVGVYGDRGEIIRFLSSLEVIDDSTVKLLQHSRDNYSGPMLRSGIYIVRPVNSSSDIMYAVYWPEDTTWMDNASSGPRRNRITFMRYLTKISEQVLCLMSREQSQAFVWDHEETEEEEGGGLEDMDDGDRLYTFEITKTNEQEEGVTSRQGFQIQSQLVQVPEDNDNDDDGYTAQVCPRLLVGEVTQGFLSVKLSPSRVEQTVVQRPFNDIQLREFLKAVKLQINCDLTDEAVSSLIGNGLQYTHGSICDAWKERSKIISKDMEKLRKELTDELAKNQQTEDASLEKELLAYLISIVLEQYPDFEPSRLSEAPSIPRDKLPRLKEDFFAFLDGCQSQDFVRHKAISDLRTRIKKIGIYEFQEQKRRIACVRLVFQNSRQEYNEKLVRGIIAEGAPDKIVSGKSPKGSSFWPSLPRIFQSGTSGSDETCLKAGVKQYCDELPDTKFLASIQKYVDEEPLVEPATRRATDLAYSHFSRAIGFAFETLMRLARNKRQGLAISRVEARIETQITSKQEVSRNLFIQEINSVEGNASQLVAVLDRFRVTQSVRSWLKNYEILAQCQRRIESVLEYRINKLEIPSDHRHNLQLDPSFIPTPSVNQKDSASFSTPLDHRILHAQLLAHDRILLVIDDQRDNFAIYLESTLSIGNALQHRRAKRTIRKDKVGRDILITYDETRRILIFCAPHKLILYVFMFDESFGSLQSWANPFELASWYNSEVSINNLSFVTGSEEVLLVDSMAQARIFSLVSQHFRPASISLAESPISAMSSPDGACALFVFQADGQRRLRAYHWDTFGATEGTVIPLPESNGSPVATSFVNRQSIHLVMVNEKEGCCRSIALDITKKSSEFLFKEKGVKVSADTAGDGHYVNNCLIDCFADVWTRFPVVAAVSRQTITSSAARQSKRIVFVSDLVHNKYASYFADMIRTFEDRTKKPTDGQLRAMVIGAKTYDDMVADVSNAWLGAVSRFCVGQWLVDLLCLLPIHIAVARENRFIPLKDGITSAEFEKSLLGAEVGGVVDNLSFGWYESILCSYMADKGSRPVKVVSSMGEQSVGKSFALNHLVDTSFAGSAMRTTEGVWMSITPTDDALLVALDFEGLSSLKQPLSLLTNRYIGVHSIERSPQEDALLVLFNTAISNLVLFRNNFALSRDIADLFQSFQASSVILDPAANPSLFQSTLVIIIKDVVESDKREIVREFSLKFQKIVQEEQGANFISRLHAGRLNIIPWPVIESSQFYTLFSTLKRRLDSQKITHPSAGEFLHTLKILMAKLKTNDWGAMSQTLAAHRAQSLLNILPVALEHGMAEVHPDNEPLKNLDNDTVIDCPDTPFRLFPSSNSPHSNDREAVLADLQKTWDKYNERHDMDEAKWSNELGAYLAEVVKLRVTHVETWIAVNLQRFKSTGTNVEMLQREMANAVVDLQANVELCKMTCSECNLTCTLSRRHDPTQQPHECGTDHQCPHPCDFADDHPDESKFCHSLAGHDGPHICVVEDHLCGEPCSYADKKGCQGECTQVIEHEGEHFCSARKHACGKPCGLQITLPNGTIKYACPGTCSYASGEDHDSHICDNRMCPMACELCRRLCASDNHLHALDNSAIHLCGEAHRCQALCGAGICEIDTKPQSIDATFTGRHETFQYTKYAQVSKRLPCVKPVPAGKQEHEGQHIHSLEPSPFHFCEIRCGSCGYFCTLPRGHPQQEHETSHGSMSRTRWTIDGPDGTVVELNGRRFGANDEGAPMMCNLVCQSMGRHAHLDYCRADRSQGCAGPDHQHITARLAPNPDQAKDWISHALHWRRSGFKDPYSRDDQTNFARCDAMCSGPEHAATANQAAQPSYCTLPIFHPPHDSSKVTGLGYVSNDGHYFSCKNPVVLQQAFHVIFVIDRSGSMSLNTPTPLPTTPVTPLILPRHNDRLGAVYLSLYGFWCSRQVALSAAGSNNQPALARRDSYSVLLFESGVTRCFENDFQRTPENLLRTLLQYEANGGTNYESAIRETEGVMRRHWSTERSPVVIFLSDGECSIRDETMRTLCRAAVSLGKPLSFHSVSFGPRNETLRRMAQLAREVEVAAPKDPLRPATAHVESSYAEALDSVRLAETFLGIAESLKKTRGALMV